MILKVASTVCFCVLATSLFAEWQQALPGWQYEFPRDHRNHPDFKTEWWYFTGNLKNAEGKEFGYQLTFFRHGVRSSEEDVIPLSRFVVRDVKFAHFAVGDLSRRRFYYYQKISRGAYGEAGFEENQLAWIEDWELLALADGSFQIRAAKNDILIDLQLIPKKPPVIHGEQGVSQKAAGEGRASHYYSLTSLKTHGLVHIGKDSYLVEGMSWFDHEWASNQLAEDQIGWDWISLYLDGGIELMLYQMRKKDGSADVTSSGTFVAADGVAYHLSHSEYSLRPVKWWTSSHTGAHYPIVWEISIPSLDLMLHVKGAMEDQELVLNPVSYWEGVIKAEGTKAGHLIHGQGYLEMTGYSAEIDALKVK